MEDRIKKNIKEIMSKTRLMQLATSVDNQPWICSVYYAFDEDLNIYWISKPERRHSKEIEQNQKVSIAIAYSQEPYPEEGIQGVQIEGVAAVLTGDGQDIADKHYSPQLRREETLLADIKSGANPHLYYVCRPTRIKLFDTINFPDNPQQIMELTK